MSGTSKSPSLCQGRVCVSESVCPCVCGMPSHSGNRVQLGLSLHFLLVKILLVRQRRQLRAPLGTHSPPHVSGLLYS